MNERGRATRPRAPVYRAADGRVVQGRAVVPLRTREQWSYDNLIFMPTERPIA